MHGQADFHAELVARGHQNLMNPNDADLEPYQTHCGLSYVSDPDGAKIELIDNLKNTWRAIVGLFKKKSKPGVSGQA